MATYKKRQYLLMCLDPVHIGTGGYRLGRVDNSIVREPGTNVPKIPGTSLHGAARSYSAQLYEHPEAAGQDQKEIKNEPGQDPICYTFGYIKSVIKDGQKKEVASSGVINVFDAQILFFPVHSMRGPVWVTTQGRLEEAGFSIDNKTASLDTATIWVTFDHDSHLNLGWLMLKVAEKVVVEPPEKWKDEKRWLAVKDNIALVHESLFSHVVNSNLEVRTSVAINPETGAAEDKALFTYEALPRTTFLSSEVVLDNYRAEWPLKGEKQEQTLKGNSLPPGMKWDSPLDVFHAGLKMMEWLGVGGMGTRGFGRIAVVGDPLDQKFGDEVRQ
jgi:CRISPR-associated protein Cmr4